MAESQLEDQLSFFKKVSLLQNLSDDQITKLVDIMSVSEVNQGDIITHEGANEDTMFILLKGEVEISKRLVLPLWGDSSGKQEKYLIILTEKQHAFFGEMALFDDKPERSASITAIKPCKLAVLQKRELLDILECEPKIGETFFKNIATELTRRLIKANKDVLKLTTAFSLAIEGK